MQLLPLLGLLNFVIDSAASENHISLMQALSLPCSTVTHHGDTATLIIWKHLHQKFRIVPHEGQNLVPFFLLLSFCLGFLWLSERTIFSLHKSKVTALKEIYNFCVIYIFGPSPKLFPCQLLDFLHQLVEPIAID